jgi:hypothetical protein
LPSNTAPDDLEKCNTLYEEVEAGVLGIDELILYAYIKKRRPKLKYPNIRISEYTKMQKI